jgi:hypothetical protein
MANRSRRTYLLGTASKYHPAAGRSLRSVVRHASNDGVVGGGQLLNHTVRVNTFDPEEVIGRCISRLLDMRTNNPKRGLDFVSCQNNDLPRLPHAVLNSRG